MNSAATRFAGVSRRYVPAEVRFWRFVAVSDGCWLWTGTVNPDNGYGQFNPGHGITTVAAHRWALELALGRELRPDEDACHTRDCPNRHCVRDTHLYPGSRADNMRDAAALGRIRNRYGTWGPATTHRDQRGRSARRASQN